MCVNKYSNDITGIHCTNHNLLLYRERSKITLVDADPGANQPTANTDQFSASSDTEVATLYPPSLHEEL